MIAGESPWGVYLSLAVLAMAYNLESGTREAITYESMLEAGQEEAYLKFSSLQNGVYRFSSSGAMLLFLFYSKKRTARPVSVWLPVI